MDKEICSLNVIMKHLLKETNRLSLGSVLKQTFCNEGVLRAVKMSSLDQEFGEVEVKKFQWSVIRFKNPPLENNNLYNIQPLSDLRKGCVLWNFLQDDFYVRRNFPHLSPIHTQKKWQKCALQCAIERLRQCRLCFFCRPSWVLHLFPMGCKICYHYFFKFAPAGKNLRKVEFTLSIT